MNEYTDSMIRILKLMFINCRNSKKAHELLTTVKGSIANIVENAAFINVFEDFATNVFSVPDVVYFISISAAFLFLCVRSLDKRRWA